MADTYLTVVVDERHAPDVLIFRVTRLGGARSVMGAAGRGITYHAAMWTWLAVGVGGALGAMARHGVNRVVLEGWPALRFPVATLIVNVLGSCVFGVLAGLIASSRLDLRPHWREFVFVGILGGFTTFSTFASEVVTLARGGLQAYAAVNILLQVILSVAGLYAGLTIAMRSS